MAMSTDDFMLLSLEDKKDMISAFARKVFSRDVNTLQEVHNRIIDTNDEQLFVMIYDACSNDDVAYKVNYIKALLGSKWQAINHIKTQCFNLKKEWMRYNNQKDRIHSDKEAEDLLTML